MTKGHLTNVENLDEYTVNIEHFIDNTIVVPIVKNMSKEAGFTDIDASIIATIASELATNIVRYATRGVLTIRIIKEAKEKPKQGIELKAIDNGPGIEDIEKALSENYTTTHNSLGMGLPSVANNMDELHIDTSREKGTIITVRKWCDYGKNRLWTSV